MTEEPDYVHVEPRHMITALQSELTRCNDNRVALLALIHQQNAELSELRDKLVEALLRAAVAPAPPPEAGTVAAG